MEICMFLISYIMIKGDELQQRIIFKNISVFYKTKCIMWQDGGLE